MTNKRIEGLLALDGPVGGVKHVTPTRERALARLGVATVRDLLFTAPRRYMDFTDTLPIASTRIGDTVNVIAKADKVKSRQVRRRMSIVNASFVDDTGVIEAVWFNQPWIAKAIEEEATVLLHGTVEFNNGFRQMKSPEYLVLQDGAEAAGIRPVYRQTKGLTTGWIARFVSEALSALGEQVDPVPVKYRLARGVMSRHCALECIHAPLSMDERADARRRLAYEELLFLQLHWLGERAALDAVEDAPVHVVDGPLLAAFRKRLPFCLTNDQEKALGEILADMSSRRAMNRLLLGDVGTGKTMVAAGAFAAVADSGRQCVLMAPTEVLAKQYGEKIGPLFDEIGIRWETLTSSTPAADRRQILRGLADGTVSVLFGTHAVLEDDVAIPNLSLVAIDEQHRFGVAQRERLRAKAAACDYLSMTATPIPRSLALTIYGSLDCSYIRERPGGSRDIETVVMDKRNHFAAYDEVRDCVSAGHQAYIICPLIGEAGKAEGAEGDLAGQKSGQSGKKGSVKASDEAAEEDDEPQRPFDEFDFAELGEDLRAARKEAERLQRDVFPRYRIGLLCGELSNDEKATVMEEFRSGEIDVLVSTTVVEVGVDVPNATLIVIEDAERFGLSQLHQLRGRVGRGEAPGKAVLLASKKTPESAKRMEYIASTQDGFALAELDLSLRREGDVTGSRQHGLAGLRFSNVINDADLIEAAREDAAAILASDPCLSAPANALLAHEVAALYQKEPVGAQGAE